MTLNFMKITVIGNYVFNTLFCLNQGTGMYIYIETSYPRLPGDTARLQSPWMRGPQCMTLYYHMYGATMSCVVIYIKSQATNRLKPVWLRSRNQGDHWIQGKININETSSYQVSCKYQSSLFVYKAINGFSPTSSYISNLLSFCSNSYSLRSCSNQ